MSLRVGGIVTTLMAWRMALLQAAPRIATVRARTDVEVPASEEPAIPLDDRRGRAPPDRAGHEAQYPRVVDREEEAVVAALALVRRIVAIHPWPRLPS